MAVFYFGVFERLAGERRQCGAFDLLEHLAAGLPDMAHRPIVQLPQQTADRGIEIGQVEDPPMAQPGQNLALDNQHRAFNQPLSRGLRLRVGKIVVL